MLYETAAFFLTGDAIAGVRNGADVLLKRMFVAFGGPRGLLVFDVMLLGIAAWLIWRDLARNQRELSPRIFGGMALESVAGGVVFGAVAGSLTALLLGQVPRLAQGPVGLGLPTELTISLGAGIYEELLFRVLLVGGLAVAGRRLFGWGSLTAGVTAAAIGALLFSAFHYIGPFGDQLEIGSFLFRFIAGLLFSAMFLLRGFGITAWTHALYDVFLLLGRGGQ